MRPDDGQETVQFVVLDWDGVLRSGFLVIDWAEHLVTRTTFPPDVTAKMRDQLNAYYDGTLSYAQIASRIPELYAAGLQGLPVSEHQDIAAAYVQSREFLSSLTPLSTPLLSFTRSADSFSTIVISGGPATVLEHFSPSVGVDRVWAVRAEVKDGYFTGAIEDNPATLDRKQALIENCIQQGSIILAAGDSESDKPMLMAASHRIVIGSSLASEWRGQPNTLALPKGRLKQADLLRIQMFLRHLEER